MYNYETQKPYIFTEFGSRDFLKVRDNVNKLLDQAGAVRMDKAFGVVGGDSWNMLAYVDRMVELGEIREITGANVSGQHRVFVRTRE